MGRKLITIGIYALILLAVFVSGCAEEKEDKKEKEVKYGNVECEITNHGSEGHYLFVQCTYYDQDAREPYVDINSDTAYITSNETKSLTIYNIPVGEKYRPTVKLYTDITDMQSEPPDETFNGQNYWWYIYGDDDAVEVVVIEDETIKIQLSIDVEY